MKFNSFPQKAIFFFFVFTAVSILLSYWLGFFWKNSFFILAASFLVSFFLFKKFSPKFEELQIPSKIFFLSLACFLLSVYPLLFITPFYPPSTDPVTTISTRLLSSSQIPSTYSPYSDISFSYHIGFFLFSRLFVDLFPFFQDYLVLWFFGALFSALELLLVFLFSKKLFNSESIGFFSALLFLGTKVVFQSMFFGMYSWILGSCLMLLFLILFLDKNKLMFLFFPAVFAVHPGAAFNLLIFLLLVIFLFKKQLMEFVKLLPALLLALPAFVFTYSVYLLNVFSNAKTSLDFSISNFFSIFSPVPLWMGWVPLIVFLLALLFLIKKRNFNLSKKFCLLLVAISVLLYGFFALIQSPLMGKLIELYSLGGIFFGAIFLSEFSEKFKFSFAKSAISALLIILILFSFFSSGYLSLLMKGEKISREEAEFAFAFKQFDPLLERAVIFSEGSSKIAELSNKIPFDVMQDYFVSYDSAQTAHNAAYEEMLANSAKQKEIFETNCIECIYSLEAKYVVINEGYFPISLEKPMVFKYKNFKVYSLEQ